MHLSDLHTLLDQLAQHRPIFHSEADFQHELAWLCRTAGLAQAVRLERPFTLGGRAIHLDLWLQTALGPVAIELKYWKKRHQLVVDGELFQARSQDAQDLGRYDFWKDVTRLETLVAAGHAVRGFAVALSGDPSHWRPGRHPAPIDAAFRLTEGREVAGTLAWADHAGGTTRGREDPLEVQGRYTLRWRPYARPSADVQLQVLSLQVPP